MSIAIKDIDKAKACTASIETIGLLDSAPEPIRTHITEQLLLAIGESSEAIEEFMRECTRTFSPITGQHNELIAKNVYQQLDSIKTDKDETPKQTLTRFIDTFADARALSALRTVLEEAITTNIEREARVDEMAASMATGQMEMVLGMIELVDAVSKLPVKRITEIAAENGFEINLKTKGETKFTITRALIPLLIEDEMSRKSTLGDALLEAAASTSRIR